MGSITRYLGFVALMVLLPAASTASEARPGARAGLAQGACQPDSVGVDTLLAGDVGDIILGMAWGETFTAADTLISSVTVWRLAAEHNDPSPLKFWITEVDSSGRPHTHLVVYDGPTLSFTSPDSIRPTTLVYSFDPPIALPRPSTYCFWVQEVCAGYADLLIDTGNHYPGGSCGRPSEAILTAASFATTQRHSTGRILSSPSSSANR